MASPQAVQAAQVVEPSSGQSFETSELGDGARREREGVLGGRAGAQQDSEELGVAERRRARVPQTLAGAVGAGHVSDHEAIVGVAQASCLHGILGGARRCVAPCGHHDGAPAATPVAGVVRYVSSPRT